MLGKKDTEKGLKDLKSWKKMQSGEKFSDKDLMETFKCLGVVCMF